MDYYKYHALGNDYLIIDPQKTYIKLTPEIVRMICHRNLGIGADGLLFGPIFEDGIIHLQIFNSDGSEAEKSGNGIRIFGRYLMDENYIVDDEFSIVTKCGEVQIHIKDRNAGILRLDMGPCTFKSTEIPVSGEERQVIDESLKAGDRSFSVTCLSVGNPHCVIHLDEISRDIAITYGPLIERHHNFPNRINVQFTKIQDRHNIALEIWERGSGYTLSSGSSSCAAACASIKKGLVDSPVTVHMPGGNLLVEFAEERVLLTGPAMSIAEGIFTYEMWKRITG